MEEIPSEANAPIGLPSSSTLRKRNTWTIWVWINGIGVSKADLTRLYRCNGSPAKFEKPCQSSAGDFS